MKKVSGILFIILFSFNLFAQKAEEIISIVKVPHEHAYFVEQAELWWNIIEENKSNENAWYNYFLANRYARFTNQNPSINPADESKYLRTDSIIFDLLEENIPNTFTHHFIIWKQGGANLNNEPHLQEAYSLNPDFPGISEAMLTVSELKRETKNRKKYNLERSANEISSGLLAYSYNVLMTAEENAIILSNGDNDTYPQWFLQDVKGIRTDVHIMNINLLLIESYRNLYFQELGIPLLKSDSLYKKGIYPHTLVIHHILTYASEKYPIYIGLTMWKKYYSDYQDNLYIVGLALKYSEDNIDNIALLKKNFSENYALDYLKIQYNEDPSIDLVNRTNINYLPGLIKLYEHYKLSGDVNGMEKSKQYALLIINASNDEKWIEEAVKIFE